MLQFQKFRLFLTLRIHLIKMIKIMYITLVIVSNMVDQGRAILQNIGLCNLSIRYISHKNAPGQRPHQNNTDGWMGDTLSRS